MTANSNDPTSQVHHRAVSTNQYNYDELADIYNQARVDYIVPMPMNGKRMKAYCDNYDIDLDLSLVAIDVNDGEMNGVCMLGIRGDRSWITRLGVIPNRRRRRTGEYLMRELIDRSIEADKKLMILEVIKGNDPARKLFEKVGFYFTRELLIIRRPPSKLAPELVPSDDVEITDIPTEEIPSYLEKRDETPSWIEENESLLNAGNLKGLTVRNPDGEEGWLVYQSSPFQMTHFVMNEGFSDDLWASLLGAVHTKNALQDTKLENIPADHPALNVFYKYGYVESFARTEMYLDLTTY